MPTHQNQLLIDKDLLHDTLHVLGEWLEEITYQVDERGMLDAEAEAEWQTARRRADDVFDRLSRAGSSFYGKD